MKTYEVLVLRDKPSKSGRMTRIYTVQAITPNRAKRAVAEKGVFTGFIMAIREKGKKRIK